MNSQDVLLCGGGDGALQDFLRVITGQHSAAAILQRVPGLPSELLVENYRDEDQAHRASLWNDKMHNHWVFERRDLAHRRLVAGLLASPRGHQIEHQLQLLLTHSSSLDLTLIHPCSHFSQSYPLNRFLALLIEQYGRSQHLQIQIVPNTVLHQIQGVSPHACAKKAVDCHGQDHEADFGIGPTCFDSTMKIAPGGYFQVVVVRVGVVPPPPFTGIDNPLFSRHFLPFHSAS